MILDNVLSLVMNKVIVLITTIIQASRGFLLLVFIDYAPLREGRYKFWRPCQDSPPW